MDALCKNFKKCVIKNKKSGSSCITKNFVTAFVDFLLNIQAKN